MISTHKPKFPARRDLKARVTLSRHKTLSRFALAHGFSRKTVYAVLDGYRAEGPVAKKILQRLASLRAA